MYDSSNTQKCKMTLGLMDKSIDPCKKVAKQVVHRVYITVTQVHFVILSPAFEAQSL